MEPYRSSLKPVPCKQSGSLREWILTGVDPNGSEHIRSRVNVALKDDSAKRGGWLTSEVVTVMRCGRNFINVES